MKKVNVVGLAIAFASATLFSQFASSHTTLKSSVPAAGAVVEFAPHDISLTFSEKVDEPSSLVTLKNASGKAVVTTKARVSASDSRTLHLSIPTLPAGQYSVRWVAVSHSNHRHSGEFNFTVK